MRNNDKGVYRDPRRDRDQMNTFMSEDVKGEKIEPDTFAGPPVIPWRGQEPHGVPIERFPELPEEGRWKLPIADQDEQEPYHEPVPVKIVHDSGSVEVRRYRTFTQSILPGQGILAVSRDPRRLSVLIRNTNTVAGDIVYIGDQANVGPLTGYPILPGSEVKIEAEEPIFAFVAATVPNIVALSFLYLFTSPADYDIDHRQMHGAEHHPDSGHE